MWILKGENFTERNPKQKRHPFSHATQVFARFENPFFFELAFDICLAGADILFQESGLQVTQIEGEGPCLGLLKGLFLLQKTTPPFQKTRRKNGAKNEKFGQNSFFCLLGRCFFFSAERFSVGLVLNSGALASGIPPSWLVDSS